MPMTRAAALAASLGCLFAAAATAQDLLVRAGTVVIAPDTVLRDGEFLVRQGRIAYVGTDIPTEARARAQRVDHPGATIVPGFVLAHTWLGQEAELAERATAFTPSLRAAEAFDPWQEELPPLLRFGITAAALAPSSRNTAGGIAALIRPGKEQGELRSDDLYLKLSLAQVARSQDRPPTSLMGAIDLLRRALQDAKLASGGADQRVLQQVLQKSRRVMIHADTYAELSAALDLSKEFGIEPILLGAAEADKVLPRLVQTRAWIVLGSLSPDAPLQALQLPATLARASVPFAFAGRPQLLRLSAALAVRHGLDRRTALAALTRGPATLLDQQQEIGSLRSGCSADFAVFGGDPLDLDTPLLATFLGGQRVFGGEAGAAGSKTTTTAATVGER